MVQIRLGNMGRVTPGRAPSVNPPALNQTARAVEALGGTLQGIGLDAVAQETRRAQEELREQRAQAEAAERAREAAEFNKAQDRLRDLHDDIGERVTTGQLPRDQAEAEFSRLAKEAADESMQRLRPETRPIAAPRIDSTAATLGNSLRRTIAKRAKQEVTGSITESLEYFQRLYRTDPAKATEGAMGTLAAMGPWSDLSPDQRAKLGQVWKEQTQYTAGFEAISSAREDRKGLAAAEQFIGTLPDLDPQKRAQLLDRVQAYRMTLDQNAELAAQRAERERDRVLKRAEHEFNAFQALADKGTALSPEYVDRAIKATAGTPYAGAIAGIAEQARVTGGLAAQPVTMQQAALDRVNTLIAQNGRTPELDKRKDQIEKVLRGSQADLERDALRAGLERGVIAELPPLNVGGGLPALVPQLAARVDAAQRVGAWAGRPVSPLTEDEAAGVKRQLDVLPVAERSAAIAALAQGIGPQQASGLAAQMDKKDRALALAFATAADRTTTGRLTSELILKGQQAKADGTSTKNDKAPDLKVAQWRRFAAGELDGVFGNAQFTGQVRDAAEFIMHGIAAEQGGRLTTDDMERAVRLAVGGEIVEHAGRRIPLPAGIDQSMLERRLKSITPAEIGVPVVRAGGKLMGADDLVQSLPAQPLMPVRPGEFAVLVGGRPVTDEGGAPILIRVR